MLQITRGPEILAVDQARWHLLKDPEAILVHRANPVDQEVVQLDQRAAQDQGKNKIALNDRIA